ncbi:DUF2613 family protein [Haloechinothrix salitolerans]|uniref:DUF2613 family protein n=1 Tax=Haloechinothrix salitolerans TaxID=926830 RepID=A0ABW2BT25_9PSEU
MAKLVGVLTSVLAGLAVAIAAGVGLTAAGNPDANVDLKNNIGANNVYNDIDYGTRSAGR